MKKGFLLITLMLGVSCGVSVPVEEDKSIEQRLDSIRSIDSVETLSAGESQIIQTICLDLQSKKSLFRNFSSLGTTLSYTGQKKSCSDEEASALPNFTLGIEDRGDLLVFSASETAPFRDIIVHDRDEMALVCDHVTSALSNSEAPTRVIKTGANPLWIFPFSEGDGRCLDQEVNCLYVESGVKSSGTKYKIRDVSFFAVNADLNDPLRGVVVQQMTLHE